MSDNIKNVFERKLDGVKTSSLVSVFTQIDEIKAAHRNGGRHDGEELLPPKQEDKNESP